ncbi:MAG: 16S rRNA (cytosine(1402)-N(4))-methyltransferase RsmH [Candidatus Vogelbacteria bacterium]|nr:16S rRNA (cytosine(1402)-N(4))-methyltransferase RsmH [Candidatus Vogelbacteria bacterium]
MTTVHIPVLLKEVIEGLRLRKGDIVVDGTLNAGGHSKKILEAIEKEGTLVGIDADPEAIKRAEERLGHFQTRVYYVNDNFRNLGSILDSLKIDKVNAVLLDLGMSSDQLESGRGFSFQKDEPLIMTFGDSSRFSAKEIVNNWSEESIADVIWGYGGERYARRIAHELVSARENREVKTSGELVEIVRRALPKRALNKKIHFATKTFQALRITANDELGALRDVLPQIVQRLMAGGRVAAITFHSLEDRIVKQFFKEEVRAGRMILVNRKPIYPSPEEVKENARSRSAKLRIAEKI